MIYLEEKIPNIKNPDIQKYNTKPKLLINKNQVETDSVSFSASQKIQNKTEDKNKLIAYTMGALALAAGIIFAVVKFKKGKTPSSDIGNNIKKGVENLSKNDTDSTRISSKSDYFGMKRTAEEQKIRDEKVNLFKQQFRKATEESSLEDLKKAITSKIPDSINFDKPSEMLKQLFKDSTKYYDEDLLINLYILTKKLQPRIKDPKEALKCKQSGLYILSELNRKILSEVSNDTILQMTKYKWIEKQIKKEVEILLDSDATKELPSQIKNLIKEESLLSYIFSPEPNQAFSLTLNKTAESCLDEIIKKHIANGKMTFEGKRLFDFAEKMNNEATDLNIKMGTTDELTELHIGSINTTIKNFKKGIFKSGRDKFWEEYFNKKYQTNYEQSSHYNTNGHYNDNDIKKESLNIFKKYGENLGDLSNLKKDVLKKARAKLSFKYHPDCNKGNENETTKIMQEINAAFDELITEAK